MAISHHCTPLQKKLDASTFFPYFMWFGAFNKCRSNLRTRTTTLILVLSITRCKLNLNYVGRNRHPQSHLCNTIACQAWSKSHERCPVRLARAASSHHPARCKVHKKQSTTKASTPTMTIVFYSCNRSTYRHGSDTIVGFRSMENKKFLPHKNKQAKIYLLDCSNELME